MDRQPELAEFLGDLVEGLFEAEFVAHARIVKAAARVASIACVKSTSWLLAPRVPQKRAFGPLLDPDLGLGGGVRLRLGS
jgi:hypothetical protein